MKVKHCVVISDLHFGCSFALCPPKKLILDTGVEYTPSGLQLKLWKIWEHFWKRWVPSITKGEPFYLVINGDILEGVHHGIVTPISQNFADQIYIASQTLKPIVKRAAALYMVRGTESHAGKSSQYEEILADQLNARPISQESTTAYSLWLKLGTKLIHFCHHIGTSSSSHGEASALVREINDTLVEAAKWGFDVPEVLVRSHRHSHIEVAIPYKDRRIVCFTTPGWQLKTPFVFKISKAKTFLPQIGGSIISNIDGSLVTYHFIRGLRQD